MASLTKIFAVAAKAEAVRLTDSLPTLVANAVRVVGAPPTLRMGFLETNPRTDAQSGRLGSEGRAASAGRWGTVSISCECHGLGLNYATGPTYIDQDPLLRACGFSRAVTGGAGAEQVDYTSADSATTCTLYLWSLDKLHILTGCVGTFAIEMRSGQVPRITYEMTGVLATDPTTAAPGAQTLTTMVGPVFSNAALSVGTFDVAAGLQLLGATFTLGNTITALPSAGALDAHNGYEVSDRAPTLSLSMFVPSLAAYNAYTKARSASDAVTIAWGVAGTPVYNGLRLALAAWEAGAPDVGDEGGVGTFSLSGPAKHSGATRDVIYSTR